MRARLLSALDPAPPGFAPCVLSKRILLSGPLVLLVSDLDAVFGQLPDGRERIEGLLVTPGAAAGPQRLGRLLWTISVSEAQLPHLHLALAAALAALEEAAGLEDRLVEAQRLAERTRYDFEATRIDYNKISTKLIEDLERSKAIAAENARLYEQAQDALRARDEFLSIASHELKTPLTPMKLYLQSLGRQLRDRGDPKLEQLAAKADRQLDRLDQLVENLLDVSQLSLGKLEVHREPTDLVALVRGVLEQFALEIERARLQVSLDGEASLVGRWDRFRLEQVVVNLVSNAIKFAAGRPVLLRVGREGARARLTVADQGMGIAAQDLPRVFDRFMRAVSSRQFGGLGLGLYICKQIVEAHGGSIGVQSSLGVGTTFTVELPLEPPETDPK